MTKSIFDQIKEDRGMVARIYSDFAPFENAVVGHYDLNRAILLDEKLPLPRAEREWLAFVTSDTNENHYCRNHHRVAYENHAEDKFTSSLRNELLTELAKTLTLTPAQSPALRSRFLSAGFTEAEWQHAVNIVSYFNFANRLVFAMDLKLEDGFEISCK